MSERPPPPPPASPPPPLETTIGKYIARFRYEKPQPRESRVLASRSDFWWTKSPRYSPSPSPPSTWTSGDVFRFPEEEEEEMNVDVCIQEQKESETRDNESQESDFSVESKLRRRLGLWSSHLELETAEKKEMRMSPMDATSFKPYDYQEWSGEEAEAEEEEEEEEKEEEEEDPEQVIARVRKRLGWGTTSSTGTGTGAMTVSLKPIELRLSVDGDEDKRRRQLKLKPPLSPGSYRRGRSLESFGSRSWSTWSPAEQKERVEEGSPCSGEECGLAKQDAEEQASVARSEEEKPVALHCESVSPVRESDRQSLSPHSLPYACATTELHSTSSSVDDFTQFQESGASEEPREDSIILSGASREQQEQIPTETAETLDSLVSLVVLSWENDFFSGSASEESGPTILEDTRDDKPTADLNLSEKDGDSSTNNAPASPSPPSPTKDGCEGTDPRASEQNATEANIATSSSPSLLEDVTFFAEDTVEVVEEYEVEEEKEDCKVPGEEDDQIAQMLLGRIVLLEAALRQVDDS